MNKRIIRECVRISREKNHLLNLTFRHFTFVIQNNKIIEWASNISKVTPLTYLGYSESAGIHAETNAYKKAKGLIDKNVSWSVVNVRLNKTGTVKLSKPCPCCTRFLFNIGCKEVWFSTDTGFARLHF